MLRIGRTAAVAVLMAAALLVGASPAEASLAFVDPPREFIDEMRAIADTTGAGNDLAQQVIDNHSDLLDQLIAQGPGSTASGRDRMDNFINNSLGGVDLVETAYWRDSPEQDGTFHAYDHLTYVGPVEPGATRDDLYDILVNRYSYPTRQATPAPNVADGGRVTVYAGPFPSGVIEQAYVTDGIMNITAPEHPLYKGTARRVVVEYQGHLFIITHGEGINRAFNMRASRWTMGFFESMAATNDAVAASLFEPLDQAARRDLYAG